MSGYNVQNLTMINTMTKSSLGTVLDPLKESTEKKIKGSPYIFQWFNNKALTYRFLIYMIPNVDLIQNVPSIYLKQGM